MELSSSPQEVSAKEAATLLLHIQGQLFSPATLSHIVDSCGIRFTSEQDRARAEWEWLVFGLYAVVSTIQNTFSGKTPKSVVHELFSQIGFHLASAGVEEPDLTSRLIETRERILQFETVAQDGGLERLGFAAATFVLGLEPPPDRYPKDMNSFEFGLAANIRFTGALKAMNGILQNIKVAG